MDDKQKLNILWTNDNVITADKMVFMYATNSLLNNWWDEVTVIIWGATVKLAAENELIMEKIRLAKHAGVEIIACKACANQLGVSETSLIEMGIKVEYYGVSLTDILQNGEKLITI